MSKRKKKKEVGGNPTPGLLSLWLSSNGFKRAGRGSQHLVLALSGSGAGRAADQGGHHPFYVPLPGSLSPLGLPTPAPGHHQAPACPLLALPPVTAHVTSPHSALGAGAAVPTWVSHRGPGQHVPWHGAWCLHAPLSHSLGLFRLSKPFGA